MDSNVGSQTYERIERLISSTDSPVGIDAKKTRVLILHKLTEIERRLVRLGHQVGQSGEARQPARQRRTRPPPSHEAVLLPRSRGTGLARLLCWICLFFPVPLLGLWLAMLAWAATLDRER